MTILILEDELTSTNQLESLARQLPFPIYIQAKLTTVQAAIQWLESQPAPDLILADILLQDGLSFEIFDHLQLFIPVIYCTNYQEYVFDAFDSHVIDYILKPITAQKLAASLDKFARRTTYFSPAATQNKPLDYLPVSKGARLLTIPAVSIRYIFLKHQLVYLQTLKNTYLISQTLDELEQLLNPTLFYRANRQCIIHRQSVVSVEYLPARKIGLQLNPELDTPVIISKARAHDFLRWGRFK